MFKAVDKGFEYWIQPERKTSIKFISMMQSPVRVKKPLKGACYKLAPIARLVVDEYMSFGQVGSGKAIT